MREPCVVAGADPRETRMGGGGGGRLCRDSSSLLRASFSSEAPPKPREERPRPVSLAQQRRPTPSPTGGEVSGRRGTHTQTDRRTDGETDRQARQKTSDLG